jgi:urocanate hydratase
MMFLGLIRIEKRQIFMMAPVLPDMAIQNVIGDSFRGATWVSIHNGGGVGWGGN